MMLYHHLTCVKPWDNHARPAAAIHLEGAVAPCSSYVHSSVPLQVAAAEKDDALMLTRAWRRMAMWGWADPDEDSCFCRLQHPYSCHPLSFLSSLPLLSLMKPPAEFPDSSCSCVRCGFYLLFILFLLSVLTASTWACLKFKPQQLWWYQSQGSSLSTFA